MNVFSAMEQLVRGFVVWTKYLTNGSCIASGRAGDLCCCDHPSPKVLVCLRKDKILFIPQVVIYKIVPNVCFMAGSMMWELLGSKGGRLCGGRLCVCHAGVSDCDGADVQTL